jgi:hypothetical protein
VTADPAAKRAARDGVWACVDRSVSDGGCVAVAAVFSREVDALRFAVKTGLAVERLQYGVELRGLEIKKTTVTSVAL